MSHADAAAARSRATHLRLVATRMRTALAMDLHRYLGDDTWHGPRADSCRSDLLRAQRAVDHAADDLDRHALGLERRADELDLAANVAANVI